MTSVYKQALQSVKAFRAAEVFHGAAPRSGASIPPGPGMARANPFLVTRVNRHTPAERAASKQLRAAKASKMSPDDLAELKKKLPALASTVRKPKLSLRRQADLVKQARLTGTLHLLPPGPKTAAIQLREERVRNALSPGLVSLIDAARAPPKLSDEIAQLEGHLNALTLLGRRPATEAQRGVAKLKAQAKQLKEEIAEFEVIQLLDALPGSAEMRSYERKKELLVELQKEVGRKSAGLAKMVRPAAVLRARIEKMKVVTPARGRGVRKSQPLWQRPIKWVGEASAKKTPGAEVGLRLYAGKKRMFKGHLWERRREGRIRKQAVLMRDMAARVKAYKEYYKKRKPNPLKPSRYTKPPRLPF